MNKPPWPIRELAAHLRAHGSEGLMRDLGPFVLVGSASESDDDSGSWSFATKTYRAEDLEREERERVFDLDDTIVYPLRKRLSTFAAVILVGRASSNDIPIDDTTISKLHARIKLLERGFTLEDAGSRNGTFLEGERIAREVEVCPGDGIAFGSRAFRVYDAARFCELLSKLRT